MRVLHVLQSFSEDLGGPLTVAVQLSQAQLAAGAHAELGLPTGPDAVEMRDPVAWTEPGANEPLSGQLAGVEIVHLHELWPGSTRSVAARCRSLGRPYVISSHGQFGAIPMANKRLKKWAFLLLRGNALFGRAAALQVLTREEEAWATSRFPQTPCVRIPNGIVPPGTVTPVASRPAAPKVMLFLGRLAPQKGIDLLLRVWGQIAADAPDWKLRVVGPSYRGYAAEVERAHAALSEEAKARCELVGPRYGADKLHELDAAHLYVQPSRWEGSSMALLEAAGAGLPCLYTTECNQPEIAEAAAGEHAPFGAEAVAELLKRWLRKPLSELEAAGAAGRARISTEFSWPTIAEHYSAIYSRILTDSA